ncbi:L-2-hydroxyglutarate oxidase [Pricia sp. S334]|uniref:L-2-hydroxyglutarate oxidase n=1 Tax=Pricia mediterranea TaxID=3076079 RepID=A0ABU3L892_9FLAO|nr:L-2-hydroxyglutarate oxidase [Pricia sp. S334]MDT7829287.1 L-2-hydroxyglutarate oxidase [Pricia sp. S334]
METDLFDISIIGGGIVGLATAYKIQKSRPDLRLLILEKEAVLAAHQTGHNSGVLHSGIYYTPGSLKAENCIDGRRQMVDFAFENGIDHDICGKIIVASQLDELPAMEKVYANGIKNGLTGVRKISPEEISEIEPFCKGVAGLWVPDAGIIDYVAVTQKLAELVTKINPYSEIRLGHAVKFFSKDAAQNLVHTDNAHFRTKKMIFCGGLFADRLARRQGVSIQEKVVGFRGDYYELTEGAEHKIRNLIYPVPNLDFPFLGVHFTRMTDGGIECGPNAVFTFQREGYGKMDFNLEDTLDALSYSGTWQLFKKNWRFGIGEYRRAFSKNLFLKTLQRLVPDLSEPDICQGRSGVRALLLNKRGDTRTDFRIARGEDSIHVLNAPSPAATAALAIADIIWKMADKEFRL